MGALVEGHTLLDRFVLIRPLGRGGAAQVWLARDSQQERDVALKIYRDTNQEQRARLNVECERAALLKHPAAVQTFGFHRDGDCAFIAMEAVDGETLDTLAGKANLKACLPGLSSLASALEAAHRAGVIHRDVKVHNVIRDAAGAYRLTDFGSAACHDEKSPPGGGSLYSMSPQQLEGKPASPADDVYSFGVLIFELLSGRPPFYPDITIERIRSEKPPLLNLDPALPKPLIALVAKMLDKNPDQRPSMADVSTALEGLSSPAATVEAGFESIAPIARRPAAPIDQQPAFRPQRRRTVPATAAAAAFAGLLLLAAAVFWGLPRLVSTPEIQASSVPAEEEKAVDKPAAASATAEEPGLAPYELAELTERRRAAQTKFDAFFAVKRDLERAGVERWGGERLASAEETARNGDALFRQRDYEAAGAAYTEAAEQLTAMLDSIDTTYEKAIEDARAAYEAGDSAMAASQFELALAIDPDSADAKRGQKRVEVLDKVLEHVRAAQSHEQNGQPQQAIASYREALKLDKQTSGAQRAIDRINAGISEARFRRAMTDGINAIDRGENSAAEAAFRRALSIRPGAQEAADRLAQIAESQRGDRIAGLRAQAQAHEGREAWAEAASAYAAIRKLDDTLVFARSGESRSLEMGDLIRQIDEIVADPASLRPQAKFDDATALLERARAIDPKGPQLRESTISLARVLRDARIPITVRFVSDNQTEVVVFHVDRLGRFSARELDLLPGRYTAVGTRAGFRDVREEFVVSSGETPDAVVVRCEEKI